jgi:CheY-like chemotaxis protein
MSFGPVILVEDDSADAELTIAAFDMAGLRNPMVHLRDGESALAWLRRAADGEAALPALVLLDLGLPGVDGRDVLATIKADSALKPVPVVVVTGARAAECGVLDYYGLDDRAVIEKPLTIEKLVAAVVRAGAQFNLSTSPRPLLEIIRAATPRVR